MHLNLPEYDAKISQHGGRDFIFDALRRRFVALTPEEWVRQHFVAYLITYLGYPQSLLANEVEVRLGGKRLRCDTILYNTVLTPRMVIEYKSPTVVLHDGVFAQIAAYNSLLHAPYIVLTNGLQHHCFKAVDKGYERLSAIPKYTEL